MHFLNLSLIAISLAMIHRESFASEHLLGGEIKTFIGKNNEQSYRGHEYISLDVLRLEYNYSNNNNSSKVVLQYRPEQQKKWQKKLIKKLVFQRKIHKKNNIEFGRDEIGMTDLKKGYVDDTFLNAALEYDDNLPSWENPKRQDMISLTLQEKKIKIKMTLFKDSEKNDNSPMSVFFGSRYKISKRLSLKVNLMNRVRENKIEKAIAVGSRFKISGVVNRSYFLSSQIKNKNTFKNHRIFTNHSSLDWNHSFEPGIIFEVYEYEGAQLVDLSKRSNRYLAGEIGGKYQVNDLASIKIGYRHTQVGRDLRNMSRFSDLWRLSIKLEY